MKRIIIILCLLALCIGVSAYSVSHTYQVTDYMTGASTRALDAMSEDDTETLRREIEAIYDYWNEEEDYLIHFLRHEQIEEITKSVARLRALAAGEDYTELAAELDSICWQMEHLRRSESLILHNIF